MRINSSAERGLPGKHWSAPVLRQNTALTAKGVNVYSELDMCDHGQETWIELPCRIRSAVEEAT